MSYKLHRTRTIVAATAILAVFCCPGLARSQSEQEELPTFEQIEKIVSSHFAKLPKYRSGNILIQSEVKPLFAKLEDAGWTVEDRKDILEKVPTSGDFLVRELRTPSGVRFMRGMGTTPDAYDRLERMTRLKNGKRTVSRLIQLERGDTVINYFATTDDGKKLGRLMSKKPHGAGFNKPTGRIYTEKMLLDRLEESHKAAMEPPPDDDKRAGQRRAMPSL